MTMTSEVKLEPTAEEIERVAEVIVEKVPTLTLWIARIIARAAILAMDRRASPPAEPDAWQHCIRVSKADGGKVKEPFEWGDWSEWRDGKFGNPGLAGEHLQFRERPLYASPPAPAVAVPEGWQDISTAPQDELVLLYEPHEPREAGGFHFIGVKNRDGRWHNNLDLKEQHPTHWAPCRPDPVAAAPQPPATRGYEEGKRDGRRAGIEATGWHPIETAPKNGTDVILYCGPPDDPLLGVGYWTGGEDEQPGWYLWPVAAPFASPWPTHWAPIPAFPAIRSLADEPRHGE